MQGHEVRGVAPWGWLVSGEEAGAWAWCSWAGAESRVMGPGRACGHDVPSARPVTSKGEYAHGWRCNPPQPSTPTILPLELPAAAAGVASWRLAGSLAPRAAAWGEGAVRWAGRGLWQGVGLPAGAGNCALWNATLSGGHDWPAGISRGQRPCAQPRSAPCAACPAPQWPLCGCGTSRAAPRCRCWLSGPHCRQVSAGTLLARALLALKHPIVKPAPSCALTSNRGLPACCPTAVAALKSRCRRGLSLRRPAPAV